MTNKETLFSTYIEITDKIKELGNIIREPINNVTDEDIREWLNQSNYVIGKLNALQSKTLVTLRSRKE